ncbi:hypothetical protein IAU60_000798 [Kwoniella sp. DSM 27419]
MLSFANVAISALVASASIASAAPVKIACRGMPTSYAEGYLENYDVYHTRYLALGCSGQQNTTFFDDCCHPLLANESLTADRPAYCVPNATAVAEVSSTVAAYSATASANATATESADVAAASEYSAAAAEVTTTAAAVQAAEPKVTSTSSTSEWVAPSTTSTEQAQETQASNNNGGNAQTGGFATFFYQGGNAGACGTVHSDNDKVIAIDQAWWPDFSQPSQYCGKWITITNSNNGKSVTAQVADVCPTCVSDNSLDLSVGAFTAIASESEGSVPITWTWA